jgi:hypothetical protein
MALNDYINSSIVDLSFNLYPLFLFFIDRNDILLWKVNNHNVSLKPQYKVKYISLGSCVQLYPDSPGYPNNKIDRHDIVEGVVQHQ